MSTARLFRNQGFWIIGPCGTSTQYSKAEDLAPQYENKFRNKICQRSFMFNEYNAARFLHNVAVLGLQSFSSLSLSLVSQATGLMAVLSTARLGGEGGKMNFALSAFLCCCLAHMTPAVLIVCNIT